VNYLTPVSRFFQLMLPSVGALVADLTNGPAQKWGALAIRQNIAQA
jgi:hypothetical protein